MMKDEKETDVGGYGNPVPGLFDAEAAKLIDQRPPPLDGEVLDRFAGSYIEKAKFFRDLVSIHGSPLYVVDEAGLRRSAARFHEAFSLPGRDREIFYAMKSNNMPEVVSVLAEECAGIDVSSGVELQVALSAGAKKILFSGPGKTDHELASAVANRDRVTILVDSFGEMDRLDMITRREKATIRAGVRVTTIEDGLWRKFGIPLGRLEEFFRRAAPLPFISLEGIQFHTSWNLTPGPQSAFIARLGSVISEWPASIQNQIKFIDIGGGYWPEQGEWLREGGTPSGALRNLLSKNGPDTISRYLLESRSISDFAGEIGRAFKEHIPQEAGRTIYLEPGRWLCHENVHLLMKVVDVKDHSMVITDAGTNAIGWERFEHDFFPVINVSRPGLAEHACHILGSLCTPHDVWGFSYHGNSINNGDVLLIPTQGAYTYSLRQEFIKSLPRTVVTSME